MAESCFAGSRPNPYKDQRDKGLHRGGLLGPSLRQAFWKGSEESSKDACQEHDSLLWSLQSARQEHRIQVPQQGVLQCSRLPHEAMPFVEVAQLATEESATCL